MINKKTLLVLGAGASAPFGFPIGSGLREQIISLPAARASELKLNEEEFNEFIEDFRRSGLSIDAFLARRQQYDEMGRSAIVAVLSAYEREDRLFNVGAPGRSDWYQSLWLHMVRDVQSADQLTANQLRVLTFNYDRSLEHYLLSATRATFGLDEVSAMHLLQPFRPQHIYGDLGEYSPQSFGQELDWRALRRRRDRLKVMPSTRPPQDRRAHLLFKWAEQIVFLGFAFDPMNCALLSFAELYQATTREAPGELPIVVGTGYSLNENELGTAERLVLGENHNTFGRSSGRFVNQTCLEALRHYAELFQ